MNSSPLPADKRHITIDPIAARVTVRVGDQVIAETVHALELREGVYAPVHYIPVSDVHASLLRPSTTRSHCPYKGDAIYFDVVTSEGVVVDAAWRYRDPIPSARRIAGHIAFYRDRVDIEVTPLG